VTKPAGSRSWDFYKDISSIQSIIDVTNIDRYAAVPEDWSIFITDVVSSSAAITSGQYKSVNIAGVATITVIQNICEGLDLPFVFGGDGAVILAPDEFSARIGNALVTLAQQVDHQLKLKLRVGCVPMQAIRALGSNVLVAKFEPSPDNRLAMITGGGMQIADHLLKRKDSPYLIRSDAPLPISFQGLECRWNEARSVNGQIMTLIISGSSGALTPYGEIIRQIKDIAPLSRPLSHDNLPLTWPPKFVGAEMKLKVKNVFIRWLQVTKATILTGLFKLIVQAQKGNRASVTGKYIDLMIKNTDDIKIDDYLRMVIDVSATQKTEIIRLLDQLEADGQIKYGVHYSDSALFTCLVSSLDVHTHFIDGNDGGYSVASKDLKQKIASSATSVI